MQKSSGQGILGNYFDIETREEYWISGVKKNQKNRHWSGNGIIFIEEDILDEYLRIIKKDKSELRGYKIIKPNRIDIKEKINYINNLPLY